MPDKTATGIAKVLWRRLTLYCGIIGREHWGDGRVGPILGYQIVVRIHPWSDVARYREGLIR